MSDINNINNYNLKAQLNNISKDSQIKKSCVKEEETLFKKQMQEDTEFSELNELTQLPVEKAKPLNEKLMALLNAKKEQAAVEETPVEPENTETVASAEPIAAEETAEVTSDAELPATGNEAPNTEESEDIPNDDDGIVRIPQNYTNSEKSTDTDMESKAKTMKMLELIDKEALSQKANNLFKLSSFAPPSVPLEPTTPGSVEFTVKILGPTKPTGYDAQGRIVLTRNRNGFTSIRYNDDGTITTTTETKDFDEPQILSHVTEKTFDQDGNLINKTSTTKDKRANLSALVQPSAKMIEILKKDMAKANNNNSIISDAGGYEERKILPEEET